MGMVSPDFVPRFYGSAIRMVSPDFWLAGVTSPKICQLIALADYFRLPTVDELIRPIRDADKFCVVPKRYLVQVHRAAKGTMEETERMLDEPSSGKRRKRRRNKTKKA